MTTSIHISTAIERKKPKAGDERFLKGLGIWQIRQWSRVGPGLPYSGSYIVSNGRPVWEWVDKGSERDRKSEAWKNAHL